MASPAVQSVSTVADSADLGVAQPCVPTIWHRRADGVYSRSGNPPVAMAAVAFPATHSRGGCGKPFTFDSCSGAPALAVDASDPGFYTGDGSAYPRDYLQTRHR